MERGSSSDSDTSESWSLIDLNYERSPEIEMASEMSAEMDVTGPQEKVLPGEIKDSPGEEAGNEIPADVTSDDVIVASAFDNLENQQDFQILYKSKMFEDDYDLKVNSESNCVQPSMDKAENIEPETKDNGEDTDGISVISESEYNDIKVNAYESDEVWDEKPSDSDVADKQLSNTLRRKRKTFKLIYRESSEESMNSDLVMDENYSPPSINPKRSDISMQRKRTAPIYHPIQRNNVADSVFIITAGIIFTAIACITIGHFLGVQDSQEATGDMVQTLKKLQMENVLLHTRLTQLNRAMYNRGINKQEPKQVHHDRGLKDVADSKKTATELSEFDIIAEDYKRDGKIDLSRFFDDPFLALNYEDVKEGNRRLFTNGASGPFKFFNISKYLERYDRIENTARNVFNPETNYKTIYEVKGTGKKNNLVHNDRKGKKIIGKLDSKLEGKLDGKVYRKLDRKLDGKLDGKIYAKLDRKIYAKLDRKLDSRFDRKLYGKLNGKIDDKLEGKRGGRFDRKLYGKLNGKNDEKLGGKLGGKICRIDGSKLQDGETEKENCIAIREKDLSKFRWFLLKTKPNSPELKVEVMKSNFEPENLNGVPLNGKGRTKKTEELKNSYSATVNPDAQKEKDDRLKHAASERFTSISYLMNGFEDGYDYEEEMEEGDLIGTSGKGYFYISGNFPDDNIRIPKKDPDIFTGEYTDKYLKYFETVENDVKKNNGKMKECVKKDDGKCEVKFKETNEIKTSPSENSKEKVKKILKKDGLKMDDSRKDDTEKGDSRKLDTKKVDMKKFNTRKLDTKKVDMKKFNTRKLDTKKVDMKKFNTRKLDSKKVDARKVDTKKADSKKVVEMKLDTMKVVTMKVNTMKIDTKKDDAKEVDAKKIDFKKDDLKKEDLKVIDFKKDDLKKEDLKKIDFKKDDLKKEDLGKDDLKKEDSGQDDSTKDDGKPKNNEKDQFPKANKDKSKKTRSIKCKSCSIKPNLKFSNETECINFNSKSGDWFSKWAEGREKCRRDQKISEWQFERAKSRAYSRSGDAFWQFTRAYGRQNKKIYPYIRTKKVRYFSRKGYTFKSYEWF